MLGSRTLAAKLHCIKQENCRAYGTAVSLVVIHLIFNIVIVK